MKQIIFAYSEVYFFFIFDVVRYYQRRNNLNRKLENLSNRDLCPFLAQLERVSRFDDEPPLSPRLTKMPSDDLSETISHRSVDRKPVISRQQLFRLKISFGAQATTKSRCEWWIDATAATAWLQPRQQTSSRSVWVDIYTNVHTNPTRTVVPPSPFPFLRSPFHPRPHPLRSQTTLFIRGPLRSVPILPAPLRYSPLGALIRPRSLMACSYETAIHILT